MRNIYTKFCVRSIERQQSILAASGRAMRALLHRGREDKFESSQCVLTRTLLDGDCQCRTSFDVPASYNSGARALTSMSMGALTSLQ